MPIDIVMPKLSDTMEEGKLLKWLKSKGDHVEKGEKIFEVETDKADMEVEAFDSGVLSKILLEQGKTAEVGTTIALLTSAEEETAEEEAAPSPPEKAREGKEPAGPEPKEKPEVVEVELGKKETVTSQITEEREQVPSGAAMAPAPEAKPMEPSAEETRIAASPLARRIAQQDGIDLSQVKGTGPRGRITKEDVESAARVREEGEPPGKEVEKAAEESRGGTALEELSSMRRAIAKTVVKSKTEIPHFYVTVEVDVTEMVKLKASLETSRQFADRHLTYTHLIIKASVRSLKEFPMLNAYFRDGKVQKNRNINIGVVVAVKGGLLIPVIKNCEELALVEIADRENELVQKARNGRLSAGDLTGGTFSISNAGILDVDEFAAIIYPPQSAILAVASIKDKPKVEGDRIVPAKMMRMTISVDHRMLDGIVAARFLDECKSLLENPAHLIV